MSEPDPDPDPDPDHPDPDPLVVMDLASRDSYIQKLASKVISQRDQEPKKRPLGNIEIICVGWS